MFLIDIISHTGHIWSQLLLGKKTDGKVLVRGHEGWVQSGGGKDNPLWRQAGCRRHGQHTSVQNKTWLLVDKGARGGRRGAVNFGLSSRQKNYSGLRNEGGQCSMHGYSNIGGRE